MSGENWKHIKGFHGYLISSFGRIKSWKNSKKPKYISQRLRSNYLAVDLWRHGKRYTRYVQRLVADHFVGDVDGKEVHHKDGITVNNWDTNLEIRDPENHGNNRYAIPF